MRLNRRKIIAFFAAAIVAGAIYAAAASLGGITSATVGADDTVVASCDTDGVTTAYTTAWDAVDQRYEVTVVTVGGVSDTCDGLTLYVTLTNAAGAQIGAGSVAIPSSVATSHAVTLTTAASSELTEGVHVLIV
jgi:hypothetical protein